MTDVKQEYGGALYLLCEEEHLSEICLRELASVRKLFDENTDYIRLLEAPTVTFAEKAGILDEAFSQNVHEYVLNFLKILTENNYISAFGACCDEFEQRYNADRNISIAKVTSAVALTEEQQERLCDKLQAKVGKTVILQCETDPTLLGGLRVEIDGRLIDGTVKNKIDSIRDNLKKTVI